MPAVSENDPLCD